MEKIEVAFEVLGFARRTVPRLVPAVRSAGFADVGARGAGDLLDLVGSIVLFEYLRDRGVPAELSIVGGSGDEYDVRALVRGAWRRLNVKTSRYGPVRDGLHLMVKREELGSLVDGYVQVFVHLDGPSPHVHLAGFAKAAELLATPVGVLPNTGGHEGVQVRCSALHPLAELVPAA